MYQFLCFSLLLLVHSVQSQCENSPLWLFALPEDVQLLFPGLEEPIALIQEGQANSLVATFNPLFQRLFFLQDTVQNFPLVWCVNYNQPVNYSLDVSSFDPTVLEDPRFSIPNQGVITSQLSRFRVAFRCIQSLDESVTFQIQINTSTENQEFCSANFFVSKFCDSILVDPDDPVDFGDTSGDGVVNFTIPLKNTNNTGNTVIINNGRLGVILPAVLVPLFIIIIIGLAVIVLVWVLWYRSRSKAIAEFNPESVGLAYQQVYFTSWQLEREPHEKEFPQGQLELVRELGEGAFGIVFQGTAQGILEKDSTTNVAVKQLRKGSSNANEVSDFFREVDFMSKLDHPNVVKLLGVCSREEPFSMVFEYMDLGDLCCFLREALGLGPDEDEETAGTPLLTHEELLSIVLQVAKGMEYISSLHLVHRDLATRNCLVATGLEVKIADFGMSRDTYNSDYYRVQGNALLPVRWMPPESILYGKFTTATDVWAFGILLWEVFTFGQQPYAGLTNEEVVLLVQKGGSPEPPNDCPRPVVQLMNSCYDKNPKKRPPFAAIVTTVTEILEGDEV